MQEYQFVTDAYRLFSALTRVSRKPHLSYNSGRSQKYVLRQIKALDFALIKEGRGRSFYHERAVIMSKDEAGNTILPGSMDVALLMLYGQILAAGGSDAYALNYFYRAHALQPDHPLINLSIALAYIHYALKRQSSNRHFLIMQGFSFLFAYYNTRKLSASLDEKQEAEYNIGRTYHLLGLVHMAIPFYERCLTLSSLDNILTSDISEGFELEAALALQGIWMRNEEWEKAQAITKTWLVL